VTIPNVTMTLRSAARAMALSLAATLATLVANPAQAAPPKKAPAAPAGRNWNQTVVRTARDSFLLGNPNAPVKLVEYISYTCPHCAHFTQEADALLRLGFIAPGKGSIEVRNFVRDPIDLTVALLTHCVPPAQFWQTHLMFLTRQEDWIGLEMTASQAQRQRWITGPLAGRTRAIANDFKFYDMMASRGVSRAAADRCLADEGLANRLAANTKEAADKDYVEGTPAFMINGLPLAGTASWAALKPQLEARIN